jgi:hypothetical protein
VRARNRNQSQYLDLKVTADVQLTPEELAALHHPNTGLSEDPVHTFSGSFTTVHTDIAIPGRGPAIAFTRTDNSADSRVGPLGPGWTHS